jgi:hypothetical protein
MFLKPKTETEPKNRKTDSLVRFGSAYGFRLKNAQAECLCSQSREKEMEHNRPNPDPLDAGKRHGQQQRWHCTHTFYCRAYSIYMQQ